MYYIGSYIHRPVERFGSLPPKSAEPSKHGLRDLRGPKCPVLPDLKPPQHLAHTTLHDDSGLLLSIDMVDCSIAPPPGRFPSSGSNVRKSNRSHAKPVHKRASHCQFSMTNAHYTATDIVLPSSLRSLEGQVPMKVIFRKKTLE
ncbi:hypothetical protein OPQ81_009425 [Rhizoctonia solani]|nr:hypothetical protein OPQ81_009425 [Rhizoctonia solani]